MFLESICIEKGIVQNAGAHIERMRQTAARFGFIAPALPGIASLIPSELEEAKVKCRIIYHTSIEKIGFEEYFPKSIQSLKLVEASPDYSFKFADRSQLYTLLDQKGACDEILITRKGHITDTSFSNVVLRRGDEFFTPDSYLLNGTKRQKLLLEQKVCEERITIDRLYEFDRIYLINALLGIEDAVSLPTSNIVK
jgi:Branched-chain amino acid aminotransferase/4-amino-4-deoxychorismate lyase